MYLPIVTKRNIGRATQKTWNWLPIKNICSFCIRHGNKSYLLMVTKRNIGRIKQKTMKLVTYEVTEPSERKWEYLLKYILLHSFEFQKHANLISKKLKQGWEGGGVKSKLKSKLIIFSNDCHNPLKGKKKTNASKLWTYNLIYIPSILGKLGEREELQILTLS